MPQNWKNDIYLRTLSSCEEQYDIISFDVFDTLVFRACAQPSDVFELVGERLAQEIDGWQYSPATYRALRMEAEQRGRRRARAKSRAETTLDEIINELPFKDKTLERIKQLEIECEKKVIYLNDNVYSFMQDSAEKDKTIVIVSDMHHSKEQILVFLACAGVDLSLIAGCFVSSEYDCFKHNGKLMEKMLEAFPNCPRDRVLHVGDNQRADIGGAKKAGLHSLHYPVIPQVFGCVFDYEKSIYGVRLGEIESLRKIAAATRSQSMTEKESVYYELGAQVIGPVYALFAEWVVRYAISMGTKVILPFMRDGQLLSQVINRVIEARGLALRCVPVFISRQPAFVASISDENYDTRISQSLLRAGRTLKAIFDELGLDISDSNYDKNAEITLDELKIAGGYDDVANYLKSDKVRGIVLSYASQQRKRLIRYILQFTGNEPALTVDLGTKGSTARYLHDIQSWDGSMPRLRHTLLIGASASNIDNIFAGVDINAWLGIAGENGKPIEKLKYQMQVIETFVNAPCARTVGYQESGGAVCPVQEEETIPQSHKRFVYACWNGVETFQRHWLELSLQKMELCDVLLPRKKDFLGVLQRMIEVPTTHEAHGFADMEYFDSFNAKHPVKMFGALPPRNMDDSKAKKYISAQLSEGAVWPQLAIAAQNPEYFSRVLLASTNDSPSLDAMFAILDDIISKGYRNGAIFGASELGRRFKEIASILGVAPVCFVDSDKRLQNSTVGGLPVLPLNEIRQDIEYYVIASYVYAKEIRNTLEVKYPDVKSRPIVYDFSAQ